MSSFSHILFSPYFHPGCLLQNTKINIAIVMQKIDTLSGEKSDSFLTRKLEKCQSEESSRMITSKFLGENLSLVPKLDLKISRSLSPNALKRVIISLPSSRQNSTSSCSLTLAQSPRRHSPLRSLDTIFRFGQAAPSPSSSSLSGPSSPFHFSFLGQIYRQHLEMREINDKEKASNLDK